MLVTCSPSSSRTSDASCEADTPGATSTTAGGTETGRATAGNPEAARMFGPRTSMTARPDGACCATASLGGSVAQDLRISTVGRFATSRKHAPRRPSVSERNRSMAAR